MTAKLLDGFEIARKECVVIQLAARLLQHTS